MPAARRSAHMPSAQAQPHLRFAPLDQAGERDHDAGDASAGPARQLAAGIVDPAGGSQPPKVPGVIPLTKFDIYLPLVQR